MIQHTKVSLNRLRIPVNEKRELLVISLFFLQESPSHSHHSVAGLLVQPIHPRTFPFSSTKDNMPSWFAKSNSSTLTQAQKDQREANANDYRAGKQNAMTMGTGAAAFRKNQMKESLRTNVRLRPRGWGGKSKAWQSGYMAGLEAGWDEASGLATSRPQSQRNTRQPAVSGQQGAWTQSAPNGWSPQTFQGNGWYGAGAGYGSFPSGAW